jgi:carbon storage regulator
VLVLTRKVNQNVVVPNCDLVITVVSVKGETVRLGFTAPPGVKIHREEVWQRLFAEREAAAGEEAPCTEC